MYKSCQGEDSEDYVFSTPGYDPCHYFDFEGKTEIKYKLNCKPVDWSGFVVPDGHQEGIGYEYVDLVSEPVRNYPFNYITNDANLKIVDGQSIRFSIDFRNWKYMSQFKRFEHSTNDALIIVGKKEGSQIVDFGSIPKDEDSRYEVGGRMFFEAAVFG